MHDDNKFALLANAQVDALNYYQSWTPRGIRAEKQSSSAFER